MEKVRIKQKVNIFFDRLNKIFRNGIKKGKTQTIQEFEKDVAHLIYFDEVLILSKKSDDTINVLLHYTERGKKRKKKLEYNQLNKIIHEFVTNSPLDQYLFLKDQEELDFDYITRGKIKGENVLILLNNIEYSIDEIEEKYPTSWKAVNRINAELHMLIQKVVNPNT